MTQPRPCNPGSIYTLQRLTLQRLPLLLPQDPCVRQIQGYCLALAQERTAVRVHAVYYGAHHLTLCVTDPMAKLPDFMRFANRHVALCINRLLGRRENLWKANNSYRRPTLTCPDALFQDLITIMALPCLEGLVEHPGQWQGLHTLPHHIGQEEVFERPQIYFRPNSKLPKTATLQLSPAPIPGHQDMTLAQYQQALQAALDQRIEAHRHTPIPRNTPDWDYGAPLWHLDQQRAYASPATDQGLNAYGPPTRPEDAPTPPVPSAHDDCGDAAAKAEPQPLDPAPPTWLPVGDGNGPTPPPAAQAGAPGPSETPHPPHGPPRTWLGPEGLHQLGMAMRLYSEASEALFDQVARREARCRSESLFLCHYKQARRAWVRNKRVPFPARTYWFRVEAGARVDWAEAIWPLHAPPDLPEARLRSDE